MTFTVDGTSGLTFPDSTTQAAAAKGVNVQTFTSSGTWTKPSGYATTSRVLIECWGAGGSGGGGASTGGASGGGGGAYNSRWVTLSSLGATETATVGAGGTGVTAQGAGNAGGNTSLGSLITAYGGGYGYGGASSTTFQGGGGGGQLSAGGNGTSGGGSGAVVFGGRPFLLVFPRESNSPYAAFIPINAVSQGSQGSPNSYDTNNARVYCYDSFMHGGGGAQMGFACTYTIGTGSTSVWGGGGGGAVYVSGTSSAGGSSSFGGAGGAAGANNGTSNGTAGTAPGGGGGGTINVPTRTSGAGGAGQIIVTVFNGV